LLLPALVVSAFFSSGVSGATPIQRDNLEQALITGLENPNRLSEDARKRFMAPTRVHLWRKTGPSWSNYNCLKPPGKKIILRAKINPDSARIASTVPLADVHLHSDLTISPSQAQTVMDRNGVQWAGGGVVTWPNNMEGRRDVWETFSRELGDRFIPFAGQSELNHAFKLGGTRAIADAENPIVKAFLKELEKDLEAGRVKGVGTIFINNLNTDDRPEFRRRIPGNATAVKAIFALVARYGSVMRVHMQQDAKSITEFEPVMSSNRQGRVLWNQCGSTTTASQVRGLLERNSNLFCEISWRFPPVTRPELAERNIFDQHGPMIPWLRLMEDFPDRFMYANDGHSGQQYDCATLSFRRNLLPFLRLETARKVAYENAKRIFDLK